MAVQSGRRRAARTTDDARAARVTPGESAGAGSATPAFVGRDDALATVVNALEHGPALVLVEGEAGIGKTRLVREALTAIQGQRSAGAHASDPHRVPVAAGTHRVPVAAANQRILVAACPPVAEPFPLGPIVDALRRLRPHTGENFALSALGGALRPLFPEWAAQLPPALEGLDDPKETRHRLLGALSELLERLGVEVLVVEDVHWADSATLEWLLTLTAAEPAPWSVVVTYRSTDVPEGSLLPRLTSRVPAGMGHVRVELEPLDVADTRRLVESMLGVDSVSEEFASFLHERTDGVPLAVEESVRLLRERRDIIRRRDGWTRRVLDELKVPPTLRDSVLERVERLPPAVRLILQAAAIIAEPADEPLFAAVADLDEATARRGIARGLSAGLLREVGGGQLAFRHVLDAHAVEEAIPASDQWQLHRRAADALRQLQPEPVVRLARHYRAANDTEHWSHYAEQAADLVLESGHGRIAVVTLLDILNTVELTLERRVRLARKLFDAAFFGKAALGGELTHQVVDTLRAVLEIKGLAQGMRGELRLDLGRMLWEIGEPVAACEEIEGAIPDLDDRPDLAFRAMAILGMPSVADRPATWHLNWLEQAAVVVERTGSKSDQRALMWIRSHVQLLLGEDAAWQNLSGAKVQASSLKEQLALVGFLLNLTWSLSVWGRYEEARQQFGAAVEIIQTIDDQSRMVRAFTAAAYLDWHTGNWASLRDTIVRLTEEQESSRLNQLAVRQLQGLLDFVTGARPAAERRLREVTEEYVRLCSADPHNFLAVAALGRLLLSDEACDDVLSVTTPALELIAQKGVWLWATDLAPVHLEALIKAQRLGEAEDLVKQFAEGLGDLRAPAPLASLRTCRAIVAEAHGDLGRATALFGEAGQAWAALPRPYDELLTLERHGRCLLAAGQQKHGLEVLSDAQQRLSDLGARSDADRIALALRQHGVEVTRAWRRGPRGYGDQLSPRELEVAALVAQGMTNKQIADVLFVSFRTVERHVRKAMRKLDVSSRTALAVAATETGLISSSEEMSE